MGTGRVEACEPPRRLLVRTWDLEGEELVDEVWLRADGDQTVLVYEERGMPLDQLAAFGAGNQVHVEDLADYIAGRERREMGNRWNHYEFCLMRLMCLLDGLGVRG